jgi:hypothetical protein
MFKNFKQFYNGRVQKFFQKHFHRIHEINRQYATPRIQMTKPVKIILLVLRLYLLLLVGILIFKFITLIK